MSNFLVISILVIITKLMRKSTEEQESVYSFRFQLRAPVALVRSIFATAVFLAAVITIPAVLLYARYRTHGITVKFFPLPW